MNLKLLCMNLKRENGHRGYDHWPFDGEAFLSEPGRKWASRRIQAGERHLYVRRDHRRQASYTWGSAVELSKESGNFFTSGLAGCIGGN